MTKISKKDCSRKRKRVKLKVEDKIINLITTELIFVKNIQHGFFCQKTEDSRYFSY